MSEIYLTLILLLLPFAVFALRAAAGSRVRTLTPWLSVSASLVNLGVSVYLMLRTLQAGPFSYGFTWLRAGTVTVDASVYLDELSSIMLVVVWVVSAAVQVYSLSYMKGDLRFDHYFAFLSLFSFSMSGLVVSGNLLITFIFWELVGLCSYLLIGFWFDRAEASKAAVKAFIVTRLGDLGFLLGIVFLINYAGTLNIIELAHLSAAAGAVQVAALLIFAGAVGKSAQFPLHVWLPDAMEGPTPVSALIHAATMVAAGVYILARAQFLFVGEGVRAVVLAIGLVTALMAALMAVFQRDIKKVLAFSTISQLGYMMAGIGAGAFAFAMYHLTTHAFFKALLFLAAGSIFHAAHSLDMMEMGGLFGKLRWTAVLFLVGALGLAGFPGTGGFFSKDSILYALEESGLSWAYYLLLIGAFITSFYIFRVFFRVFFGEPGKVYDEAHESDWLMLVPMGILCLLSLAAAVVVVTEQFAPALAGHVDIRGLITGSAVSLAGILVAWFTYGTRRYELERISSRSFQEVYQAFQSRLYIDDFYEVIFLGGYILLSKLAYFFDRYIVDGIVNSMAVISRAVGERFRMLESGLAQHYLAVSVLAVLLLAVLMVLGGGR